jgi:WD40 repeat protein/uncharacterized caspase-like protein
MKTVAPFKAVTALALLLAAGTLARAQRPELVMHSGHSSAVENVWLSPDAGTLISQSMEKLIFWDVPGRRIMREVANVKNFFVSADNKTVATLDKEYLKLDLWEAATGKYLNTVINFSDWNFSPRGEKLVAGHAEGVLEVWDSATNKSSFLQIHSKALMDNCFFGPLDRHVVFSTQEDEGSIYLVDTDNFKIYVLAKGILNWALSADGRFLMVEDRGQVFRSFEIIARGNNLSQITILSRADVTDWRVSPRGKYVVLTEKDGPTTFFEVATGQVKLTFSQPSAWALEFTPDGEVTYGKFSSKLYDFYSIGGGKKFQTVQLYDYSELTFGPAGRILFIGNKSPQTSFVWDMAEGRQEITMTEDGDITLRHAVFSPDGSTLATIKSKRVVKDSATFVVSVRDLKTGEEKQIYEFSNKKDMRFNVYNTAVGFNTDTRLGPGRGDEPGTAYRPLRLVSDGKHPVKGNIAFGHGGELLVVGEWTGDVSVCDVKGATRTAVLKSHASPVQVFFTKNERGLNIYSSFNTYRLWDSDSGTVSEERVKPAVESAPSKDKEFEDEQKDGVYILKRKKDGAVVFRAEGVSRCEPGPDNRRVRCTRPTSAKDEYAVEVWDIGAKKIIFALTSVTWSPDFSPDGQYLSLSRKTVGAFQGEVWDIANNKLKLKVPRQNNYIGDFSPDGKLVAYRTNTAELTIKSLGVKKYTLELWSLADERKVLSVENVLKHEFSQDGSGLVTILEDRIKKWDLKTLVSIENVFTPTNNIMYGLGGLYFSRRGPKTGSWVFFTPQSNSEHELGVVFLWNTRMNQLYTLEDHSAQITSAEFSADERFLLTGSKDGTIRLWDTDSGRLQLTFFLLNGSDWVVMTPEGFFDGTPNGWKQLLWRFNNNNLEDAPVELYFNDFFHPNLLQDVLAGNPPKAKAGQELERIDRRRPRVEIISVNGLDRSQLVGQGSDRPATSERAAAVLVEVTDNAGTKSQADHPESSGAQDLRLFRNGSLVKVWHGDVFKLGSAEGCEQVGGACAPRRARCRATVTLVAGENNLTAYSFNAGNVKSNDDSVSIEGSRSLKRDGTLYVLAVGINRYANTKYNLNFAVQDVRDIGASLRAEQEKLSSDAGLNRYARTEVVTLTDEDATKENILLALRRFSEGEDARVPGGASERLKAELAKIRATQPEDALVIYYAGHGTSRDPRFYLLPYDFTGLDDLEARGVSDLELNEALEEVDAGRLLLVIDACQSGQALGGANEGRAPMNSKGLAQLAYDKGMLILTAAQSQQAALEAVRIGGQEIRHGLLTYALLQSLNDKGADKDGDGRLREREWLDYAVEQVPPLQMEAMTQRHVDIKKQGHGREIVYMEGDDTSANPTDRRVQTPRVFYRREAELKPMIIAKY